MEKEQSKSGQRTSRKLIDLEPKTDRAGRKFQLLDLSRLTFSLDGVRVLNAEEATSEQFGELAAILANVTNVEVWHLEERRDFINGLWAFCQQHQFQFPLQIEDAIGEPVEAV